MPKRQYCVRAGRPLLAFVLAGATLLATAAAARPAAAAPVTATPAAAAVPAPYEQYRFCMVVDGLPRHPEFPPQE